VKRVRARGMGGAGGEAVMVDGVRGNMRDRKEGGVEAVLGERAQRARTTGTLIGE